MMTDKINAILDNDNMASSAGWIEVFNVDSITREYIGKTDEYLMIGVGIPAASYVDEPPAIQTGFAVCRTTADNGWEQVKDYRGETAYDTRTRQASMVQNLGVLDKSLTLLAPATVYDTWNGSAWITDTDAQQSAQQNAVAATKTALIAEASSKTQLWQSQLMLGIITDADKSSLTTWMQYVQAVQAIDITATDITWPQVPE